MDFITERDLIDAAIFVEVDYDWETGNGALSYDYATREWEIMQTLMVWNENRRFKRFD